MILLPTYTLTVRTTASPEQVVGAIMGLYLLFGLVAVAVGLGSPSEASLAIGLAVVGLWVVIYTLTVVGIRVHAAWIRRRLVPLIESAADPAVRSGEAFDAHPAPDRAWP